MTTTVQTNQELSQNVKDREAIVAALRKRDGTKCQYPGEEHELDFTIIEGPRLVTIDHWVPQSHAYDTLRWTREQVWDLSNLKLMCRKHNASKGDRVPFKDGTLPAKKERTFRYRRQKRAERPEICTACNAGRDLGPDEMCASCNSGPMPERFPRWRKIESDQCDHELFWCAWCSIGVIPRVSTSIGIAMRQADSDELGEYFEQE